MPAAREYLWGGICAILAFVVWLVLTPFMATVWICDPVCDDWSAAPLVVRTAGRLLADAGAFTYAPATDVYFDYGRFFPLFYLFSTTALLILHRSHLRALGPAGVTPLLRWSGRLLLAGLVIAGAGDFASYTLGRYSPFLWSTGFGVEFISWLLVFPSAIAYGFAILRSGRLPSALGWGLLLSGAWIPLSLLDRWLITYIPNAQLMLLAVLCLVLGPYLLRRAGRADVAGARAAPA